jgi:hypothetical protein
MIPHKRHYLLHHNNHEDQNLRRRIELVTLHPAFPNQQLSHSFITPNSKPVCAKSIINTTRDAARTKKGLSFPALGSRQAIRIATPPNSTPCTTVQFCYEWEEKGATVMPMTSNGRPEKRLGGEPKGHGL